jgi:multidrug resistance efflux pump
VFSVPVERRPRRAFIPFAVLASALAIGIGIGASVGSAADQRLDDADNALQKASALLEASEAGVVSEKQQKQFDRAVARAIAHVDQAREQIMNAKDAVDSP